MGSVVIVGGGLAGSEAAWQLAEAGHAVTLFEMRPQKMTKAHTGQALAELVCSNSFRGAALTNAVGLLKEELRVSNSLILKAADQCAVPAGGALAVDREKFSCLVTDIITTHPRIKVIREEVQMVPAADRGTPVIVATGPLTSLDLCQDLQRVVGGEHLAFFDAIAPIILRESINWSVVFRQSRYGKGNGDDYGNIPLTKDQYQQFVADIIAAEKFGGHDEVESDQVGALRPFEGCMPIEDMAMRGEQTLRHGPMKPTGLTDPATGRWPYAVVQLRQDDAAGELWNIVGFQTRMRHGDQVRVLRSLPGLEQAEFVRLGTVHRNTFIDSPRCLHPTLEARSHPGLFVAGQITGVEGYVESTAGGMVAAHSVAAILSGREPPTFPIDTAIGALMHYISDSERKFFQPMNISFGLMPSYFEEPEGMKRDKDARRLRVSERALRSLRLFYGFAGDAGNPTSRALQQQSAS